MATDGITHDHLNALAARIEGSFRREVDQLRADFREDLQEVTATVKFQNGRIGKSEEKIGAIDKQVTAVRHDLVGHMDAHESFASIVTALKKLSAIPSVEPPQKTSKAFIAGVGAAILALAGLGHGAWDLIRELLPTLLKGMKPS